MLIGSKLKKFDPISKYPPKESRSAHRVSEDALEGVLELLLEPIALQDVDDAEEEKEALAAGVARRDAAGAAVGEQTWSNFSNINFNKVKNK